MRLTSPDRSPRDPTSRPTGPVAATPAATVPVVDLNGSCRASTMTPAGSPRRSAPIRTGGWRRARTGRGPTCWRTSSGFARLLADLCPRGAGADRDTGFPKGAARSQRPGPTTPTSAGFVATLRRHPTRDAVSVPNWAVGSPGRPRPGSDARCTSWRCTAGTPTRSPAARPPSRPDVALDGIAEFFEVFVTTGLAGGRGASRARDARPRGSPTATPGARSRGLTPGPVTTLRGTASDLFLALWRRHDPLAHHVDGPRGGAGAVAVDLRPDRAPARSARFWGCGRSSPVTVNVLGPLRLTVAG